MSRSGTSLIGARFRPSTVRNACWASAIAFVTCRTSDVVNLKISMNSSVRENSIVSNLVTVTAGIERSRKSFLSTRAYSEFSDHGYTVNCSPLDWPPSCAVAGSESITNAANTVGKMEVTGQNRIFTRVSSWVFRLNHKMAARSL